MENGYQQADAGHERRKHPRLTVTTLGVSITVRATLSGEQFAALLVDVSPGGCCVALPAAQARTLQDNGACACVLPVGAAGYTLEYAAAVVAREGAEAEPVHLIHLCFNTVTRRANNLLVRWIASLSSQMHAPVTSAGSTERAKASADVALQPQRKIFWRKAAA